MVNTMDEFNKIHKMNISQDKSTQQYKSRSDSAKPQGELKEEIYDLYYDVSNTITNSVTTNPNDSENTNYYGEEIIKNIDRNAPKLWVINDAAVGGPAIFVVARHNGTGHFSRERVIYPKEIKTYKNIYELRLRSAVAGTPYRVTEYPIEMLM